VLPDMLNEKFIEHSDLSLITESIVDGYKGS
jgi:hypothetical protein